MFRNKTSKRPKRIYRGVTSNKIMDWMEEDF